MNKFSAERFLEIASTMHAFVLKGDPKLPLCNPPQEEAKKFWMDMLGKIESDCRAIELKVAAGVASSLKAEIEKDSQITNRTFSASAKCINTAITAEMASTLFMWIPAHRADWYSKDAAEIVGQKCCDRFPSVRREVEEASKCYAVGRFTSAAFHMSRATEAGVRALAKAIKFKPPNNHWQLVFQKLKEEFELSAGQRPKHWKTHGKFLTETKATLDAVAKAWRNDIAHLEDFYLEEESKELMSIIPIFLRSIAEKMDEKGTLY